MRYQPFNFRFILLLIVWLSLFCCVVVIPFLILFVLYTLRGRSSDDPLVWFIILAFLPTLLLIWLKESGRWDIVRFIDRFFRNLAFPAEIKDIVSFLEQQGLVLYRQKRPDRKWLGVYMEYGNGNIKVRIVLERPFWLIAVADDVPRPDSWYDVALLRDFALSKGPDVLPLSEQIKIFKLIWRPLQEAFSSSKKQSTLARFDQLNMERMTRVIPVWSRVK